MRLDRAVDRFLEQMILEQDWTARTVDSVFRTLRKLVDDHPTATLATFEGRPGKQLLREHLGKHYGRTAASTRATRISYFHSFFAWAEAESLIDDDRVREIKRPPKRKPDVYRPSSSEIRLLLATATPLELAPLLLMSGAGFRASELVTIQWRDVDLLRARVRVERKGRNWHWLPIDPLVLDRLRGLYRDLAPDQDDHVFVAETERWSTQEHRVRRLIDPKTPRTTKTLWRMVGRACARAGVRPVGPHALRHGFANEFLRATRDRFGTADVHTLQLLMGHSRIDTTEQYLRDLETSDAADVLTRLRSEDVSQSQGEGDDLVTHPAIPLMEAAGIEPASAEPREGSTGATEPDGDEDPHERRLTGQQPPDQGGSDG